MEGGRAWDEGRAGRCGPFFSMAKVERSSKVHLHVRVSKGGEVCPAGGRRGQQGKELLLRIWRGGHAAMLEAIQNTRTKR